MLAFSHVRRLKKLLRLLNIANPDARGNNIMYAVQSLTTSPVSITHQVLLF